MGLRLEGWWRKPERWLNRGYDGLEAHRGKPAILAIGDEISSSVNGGRRWKKELSERLIEPELRDGFGDEDVYELATGCG